MSSKYHVLKYVFSDSDLKFLSFEFMRLNARLVIAMTENNASVINMSAKAFDGKIATINIFKQPIEWECHGYISS